MLQLYANWLVKLMDDLRGLEQRAKQWSASRILPDTPDDVVADLLKALITNIAYLGLRSSGRQMIRLQQRISTGTCSTKEFAELVGELRVRIVEELGDRVFYCVTDPTKIEKFFKHEHVSGTYDVLNLKSPDEFFDAAIVKRFRECSDDLEHFAKCYVAGCYTAAVFHLMRVVESGVMEVAKLAGLKDPKPSWGAILSKVDKYAFRTEYEELPDEVKVHIELLRDLSNEMHAIQRAWRNKIAHVENKLIPVAPIDHPIAAEVMIAVEVFMRSLGERLPPRKGA